MHKIDINCLIGLNPNLSKIPVEDIKELIDTIIKCGYIWDSNTKVFYNPKTQKYFKTEFLHLHNSKTFKKAFIEIWSKPDSPYNDKKTFFHKVGCFALTLSIIILLISVIISFYDFSKGILLSSLSILLFLAFLIFDKIKMSFVNKEHKWHKNLNALEIE